MNLFESNLFILIVIIVGSESVRRRVSSREWPSDGPEYEIIPLPTAVWSCAFERHNCGVSNDPNVGEFFKLTNAQMRPILGKRNVLLLNITDIKPNTSGARLITPYFQTKHHLKGCLTIDYLMKGNGVKDLVVYQQETENRCVWSRNADNESRNSRDEMRDNWHKLSITTDLQYGSPRFFIQTGFDNRPPNDGLVAISDMKFFYGVCNRNDANNCVNTSSDDRGGDEPESSSDYPNDYSNDLP